MTGNELGFVPPEFNKTIIDKSLNHPAWWVDEVLGNQLWSKQVEIIESVKNNPRTSVRSCNGAGKSFVSASIVAWFLTNHVGSIVITTAPTARQVEEILWQEIAKLHATAKYPLGGRLMKTKWDLGAKWFAMGLSTDDPNRFQGFHAPHILAVMDEACGIEPQIYEAVEAIITSEGAKVLLIGNPTEPDNSFFKTFSSPLYNKIHISAFDTPNFRNIPTVDYLRNMTMEDIAKEVTHPYLITPRWARERLDEWGDDSPAFLSRILGEFPQTGSQSMIPLSWVMRAVLNSRVHKDKPCILGVDVARFGNDNTVIAVRRGFEITRLIEFSKLDLVDIATHIENVYADEKDCELIPIDAVGVGGGVADMLRRKGGLPAIDIESGEKAYQSQRFNNKRTEMWYRVRELLRMNEITLPNSDALIGELSSPRYSFDSAGRFVLETKEDMKKRGLKSPNLADAVIYAFAFDGKYQSMVAMEQERQKQFKAGTYGRALNDLLKDIKRLENDSW